jgi:hypothetical protein
MDFDKLKAFSLLLDFLNITDKDKYQNFAHKIIQNPKRIISFIPDGYIFEYFLRFLENKIPLKDFIYLGDVYSKKTIYKNEIIFESLFVINILLKFRSHRFRNTYVLVVNEAVKYYSRKFDFDFLKSELEKLNSEIIVF